MNQDNPHAKGAEINAGQTTMQTTLNRIKEKNPDEDAWGKMLKSLNKTKADDEPLSIRYILEAWGIDWAIWALDSVEGYDKEIKMFVRDCVEDVLCCFEKEYPNDKRLRLAMEASRKFAQGEINQEKLVAAWDAAGSATADANMAQQAAWDRVVSADVDSVDSDKFVLWVYANEAWEAASWITAWGSSIDVAWWDSGPAVRVGVDLDFAWAASDAADMNAAGDDTRSKQTKRLLKYI